MTFRVDQIPLALRARVTGLSLDRALASGSDPADHPLLTRRAAQLCSERSRRRLVRGLERLCATPPVASLSAAPCDHDALELGRPALAQLAAVLRSREQIDPQAAALTLVLLTDPESPLYEPVYPEQVYETARDALFALAPERVTPPVQLAPATVTLGTSG